MKISFSPLALVAALAGFGEAGPCTAGLLYCGQSLLNIDPFNYFPRITKELTRATNQTLFTAHNISDTLFLCRRTPKGQYHEGNILLFKHCDGYCQYQTVGYDDTCVTGKRGSHSRGSHKRGLKEP